MTAVFFDLDGTLIDSRADLASTVNHTRRDFALPELPQAEILRHVGLGARYLLAHAIPELVAEADQTWESFRSHYAEHMLESVTLYPTVYSTIEQLHSRGVKLGVNTSKPAFATRAILEHFDLLRFFGEAIVAGGDCPEAKPSPLPLRECALRMGAHRLSASDWMVGDNWTDVACADNAGIGGVFCKFGFGVLRDFKPKAQIFRMDELLKLVL